MPSTVLQEAVPNSQALLDLLDLPGIYSRLIGDLKEPIVNAKLGKDGLPRAIHDTTTVSSSELDASMSQENDGETTDSDEEGSESYHNRDVKVR